MSELKSYYTEHTPYLYRLFQPDFVKKNDVIHKPEVHNIL